MPTIGLYGKLPCKGDFLQRRVPQEFVDAWDAWVRESLAASRVQLADRWLEAYLTSPVWRFALASGLCGNDVYAGVLLPSVDRVGRYFPLTLVARWDAEASALALACSQEKWFAAAEALALHALDSVSLDFENFDRDVAELAAEIDSERGWLPEAAPAQRYLPLESVQSLPQAVGALGLRELERTLQPLSLWWTDGSNEIGPGMFYMKGLPAAGSFASMLTAEPSGPANSQLLGAGFS
jgi:type VI secretion system protein ImpM